MTNYLNGIPSASKIQEISQAKIQKNNHPGFVRNRFYTSIDCSRKLDRSDIFRNNLYFNFINLPNIELSSLSIYCRSSSYDGAIKLALYSIEDKILTLMKSNELAIKRGDSRIFKKAQFNLRLKNNWYALAYLANQQFNIGAIHQFYISNSGYIYGSRTPGASFETGLQYSFPYDEGFPSSLNIENMSRLLCNVSPLIYCEFNS